MIEKIYKFLYTNKSKIKTTLITYIVSVIFATVTDTTLESLIEIPKRLVTFDKLSIYGMWIALVLLIIFYISFYILKIITKKRSLNSKVHEIMVKNTDEILNVIEDKPGYSWGKDKIIMCANNILEGWDCSNISAIELNSSKYKIPNEDKKEYKKYCNSNKAQEIIKRKNNNIRWMITNIETNYNKNDKKIFLKLSETDYLTSSFYWDKWKKDNKEHKKAIAESFMKNSSYYPHSLCLHLAIVTSDKKIITTVISKIKTNDYPLSIAVTLGEQIEGVDFHEGNDFYDDFIERWVKRALKEEFGIRKNEYERIVGDNPIKVLSFNFEGDICNVSMMTVLHLGIKFEEFRNYIHMNLARDRECDAIDYINIDDIPLAMKQISTNKCKVELHPSTPLRMLMTYLHYKGISCFVKEYEKANANSLIKWRHNDGIDVENDLKDLKNVKKNNTDNGENTKKKDGGKK